MVADAMRLEEDGMGMFTPPIVVGQGGICIPKSIEAAGELRMVWIKNLGMNE